MLYVGTRFAPLSKKPWPYGVGKFIEKHCFAICDMFGIERNSKTYYVIIYDVLN